MLMQGQYKLINSKATLQNAIDYLQEIFDSHKYARVKVDTGKRTLPQNALKSIWYAHVAETRGDVTAKDVERECKYKYGLPILRRDPMHEYVFSKAVDPLPYEKRLKVMDCFAVTSIMSVSELSEYLKTMQSDYPYLKGNKD
jgi:hypothetical protein